MQVRNHAYQHKNLLISFEVEIFLKVGNLKLSWKWLKECNRVKQDRPDLHFFCSASSLCKHTFSWPSPSDRPRSVANEGTLVWHADRTPGARVLLFCLATCWPAAIHAIIDRKHTSFSLKNRIVWYSSLRCITCRLNVFYVVYFARIKLADSRHLLLLSLDLCVQLLRKRDECNTMRICRMKLRTYFYNSFSSYIGNTVANLVLSCMKAATVLTSATDSLLLIAGSHYADRMLFKKKTF